MNFEDLLPKRISIQAPPHSDLHFVVIGAGGTGAYLMRDLVRIIALENERTSRFRPEQKTNHTITLIDGDIIEEKNLSRQNFVRQDIGKNKADVIASRYGRAFGLAVNVIPEFLTEPEDLTKYLEDWYLRRSQGNGSVRSFMPVFIDCVDNNATRLYISSASASLAHYEHRSSFTISSGNAERTGQVLLSSTTGIAEETFTLDLKTLLQEQGSHENPVFRVTTPSFFDVFPKIDIDKDPTQLSCAEQSESAPQNIVTNIMAANILFGFALRLLNREPITTIGIFYDTNTGRQSEFELSLKDLKRLLEMTPDNPNTKYFLPEETLRNDRFRSQIRSELLDTRFNAYSDYVEEQERLLEESKARALAMFDNQQEAEGEAEEILDEEQNTSADPVASSSMNTVSHGAFAYNAPPEDLSSERQTPDDRPF